MLDVEEADVRIVPNTERCHALDIDFTPYQRSQPYNRCIRPLENCLAKDYWKLETYIPQTV